MLPHPLPHGRRIAGILAARRPAGSLEHRAEVGDARRRLGPALLGDQLPHVGPGIERLHESRQVDRRSTPAEPFHVLRQPELQRLGGDRLEVVGQRPPLRLTFDQLAADVGHGAAADREDDQIETLPHRQRAGRDPRSVPPGLELHTGALEPLAVGELGVVGPGRPARQPAHVDQRLVLSAALDLRLDVELEGLDVGPLAGSQPLDRRQADVLEAVEELEADAASAQDLVEGREDDVPHACPHLPEQRPPVGVEHSHRTPQPDPRGHRRPAGVAVLVGEPEVVEPAHEGRVDRLLGGAVEHQPVAHLVVVEGVEAARVSGQPAADRAAQPGQHQVQHHPQAAGLVVAADQSRQQAARAVGDEVDQPHHQLAGKQRQPLHQGTQETGRLEHRRHRRQLPVAQQAQDGVGDGLRRRQVRRRGGAVVARRRRLALRQRSQHGDDQLGRPHHVALDGVGVAALERVAWRAGARRKEGGPVEPRAVRRPIGQGYVTVGKEGIPPVRDPAARGIPAELVVALAHQPEGVLVVAEPEVEAVLFNAVGGAAAGGALATEAPALLVDGDPVAAPMLGPGELEGRDDPGTAAADDGHLDRAVAAQTGFSGGKVRITAPVTSSGNSVLRVPAPRATWNSGSMRSLNGCVERPRSRGSR